MNALTESTQTAKRTDAGPDARSPDEGGGNGDAGSGRLKSWLAAGWKPALVLAVAAFLIYRLHFAPVPVAGSVAETGAIAAEVLGTGTLEARVQATISPKIAGLITRVRVDQGDPTTNGQPLVELDDGDLRAQVEIARADLAAVRAGVDRAAADIAAAEADAVQVRASFARNAQLALQKVISEDDLDKATQQKDVAEARLKRAQLARTEIERQVAKAGEALRYYEARLGDTRIRSPFDGLVVRRSREPGDIVVPGSEILTIISPGEMWVSAWVDETAMASLATGQPARVVFRSDPGRSYAGTVTRIAPLVDRETREFLADVTAEGLPANWAVGQRAEVYIETGRKAGALLAPLQALVWRNGQPGLFVDQGGKARFREVTLGLRGADRVEIASGLAAGERVIWPRDPKGAGLVEGRSVSKP